ncbi:MAG: Exported protein [Nitrospira sp.]|nr:cysteine rich repeat-containing protein [Nitrospira sp.]ULA58305.1 MAG: Exported protein [Nitrospira sp.]
MSTACEYLRKATSLVLWSGVVIGLSGLYEPATAGSDPPASSVQEQPAASSDSAGSTGKGPEGQGRGGRPGRKACADDVKKLCAGVKAGEGRIMQCLREHTQELSPACADMMQQRGKHRP